MLQMWILKLKEIDWDDYLWPRPRVLLLHPLSVAGVSDRKFVTDHWILLPWLVSWEVPRALRDLLRAPAMLFTPASPGASFIE